MRKSLQRLIESFKHQKILVIGDLIIDEYHIGQAIGKSSEAPVLVMREDNMERYIGGAGIVASHIKALGGDPYLISIVGKDDIGVETKIKLSQEGIYFYITTDETRPTILKQRFIADSQKLLRVSKLKEHIISTEIEQEIINKIKELKDLTAIVVSDFSYGLITPRILKTIKNHAKKYNIKLFGDSQSSSQIGDCLKFKDYFMITPTEKEARMALNDEHSDCIKLCDKLIIKTKTKNICLTRGSHGMIIGDEINKKNFPAIENRPIDNAGAGDSVLATLALCNKASIADMGLLASTVAAIKINKLGNVPVTKEELINKLEGVVK